MFEIFRRPAAIATHAPKRRTTHQNSEQPLSWEDQFAPIPRAEAREESDESAWAMWDESAASQLQDLESESIKR